MRGVVWSKSIRYRGISDDVTTTNKHRLCTHKLTLKDAAAYEPLTSDPRYEYYSAD